MSVKLKASDVAVVRANLHARNGMRCGLCRLPCTPAQAVLDHNHTNGAIRDTLHRSCNALLGKIENFDASFGIPNLRAFLSGVADYMDKHATPQTTMIHPTYKTEDEKRLARNAKARKKRAAAKA